ncbi:MAG TPA: hypothetical protein VGH98_09035 [Gemmatimonadaceae bacterium]|jgi:hypothetical protein
MKWQYITTLAAVVVIGACSENPTAPTKRAVPSPSMQGIGGTGIKVDIVPTVTLPLGLGGTINIHQAVVTNFALVENTVGQIVGLDVTGTLSGTTVDVLGGVVGVNADPFTAEASITSSGMGQCNLVTLDLSSLNLNVLGLVSGTVPLNITAKGSGAVGSLLCNLGNALSGLASGGTASPNAQSLVNSLNGAIGG